jgi:hypothetical protein
MYPIRHEGKCAEREAVVSAAGALGRLLAQWHGHLRSLPGAADADTAAMLTWPSRDICGVRALPRHGRQPLTAIAGRPAHQPVPPYRGAAIIRRACPGDIADVAAPPMAEMRYDVHFGGAVDQPGNGAALRGEMEHALRKPGGCQWRVRHAGVAGRHRAGRAALIGSTLVGSF